MGCVSSVMVLTYASATHHVKTIKSTMRIFWEQPSWQDCISTRLIPICYSMRSLLHSLQSTARRPMVPGPTVQVHHTSGLIIFIQVSILLHLNKLWES